MVKIGREEGRRTHPFSTYAMLHAITHPRSPPPPLFVCACNTQWKCIGDLTPLCAYVINQFNGRPRSSDNIILYIE